MERTLRLVGPDNVEKLGNLAADGKLPIISAIPGFSFMSCH